MKYYIASEPTDDELCNLYLLYNMSFVKNKLIGVYYIPKINYYGPVFQLNLSDLSKVDSGIFREIEDYYIDIALKMICLKCGWECEKNCNAFVFENELFEIENFIKRKLRELPCRIIRFSNKIVKLYYLDLGSERSCIFYNRRDRLCNIHPVKPIICKVTYCARYAIDKNGNFYVRVGKKIRNGKIIPTFKRVEKLNVV